MFFVLLSEKVFNRMSLADRFDRMCCRKKKKRNMPILVIWGCFISSAGSSMTLHFKRNTINNNEKEGGVVFII